jgi:cyclic pyranopterin phosphate synthase
VEDRPMNEKILLRDGYGRVIDYLRISVTDRCNLRCFYCMPACGIPFLPHENILSYEELLRIVDIFLELGIRKIRITGGEPLVRKNILYLMDELGSRLPLEELTLTTNGTMLAECVDNLYKAGIRRVNVSLDTLDRKRYERVAGADLFPLVLEGIETARSREMHVKLNVVAIKGVNDHEFAEFVQFGIEKKIDVRFIEVMPHSGNADIARDIYISSERIFDKIHKRFSLRRAQNAARSTTARSFTVGESGVKVGFISAVSHPFCAHCNKVRLMPDGTFRTCLFSDSGVNLKEVIVHGGSDEEIEAEIRTAVMQKPFQHRLSEMSNTLIMHRVGG